MHSMGKSVRKSYILPSRTASDLSFTQHLFWRAQRQMFGEEPNTLILPTVLLFSSKTQGCLCVCACERRRIILLFSMNKYFRDLYIKVFAWDSAW